MTPDPPEIDLDAYLARIGYCGSLTPTATVLADLHQSHATHIPFENLDVLLGRPPRLELDSLQAKLVQGRRGGYCFEQNLLLAAVLERLGFRVTRLAARVWYRATRQLPRTHMLLRIDLPDGPMIADVGFGSAGLLRPVPLLDQLESPQFAWCYRLVHGPTTWMLQHRIAGEWTDLYEFSEEPQHPVDYEPANHFVATHPASPFTRTVTVQRIAADVRHILRNRDLLTDRGDGVLEKQVVADADLLGILDRLFGLSIPADTRFPNHPWGEPPPASPR